MQFAKLKSINTADAVYLAVASNVLDTALGDESLIIPWMLK